MAGGDWGGDDDRPVDYATGKIIALALIIFGTVGAVCLAAISRIY